MRCPVRTRLLARPSEKKKVNVSPTISLRLFYFCLLFLVVLAFPCCFLCLLSRTTQENLLHRVGRRLPPPVSFADVLPMFGRRPPPSGPRGTLARGRRVEANAPSWRLLFPRLLCRRLLCRRLLCRRLLCRRLLCGLPSPACCRVCCGRCAVSCCRACCRVCCGRVCCGRCAVGCCAAAAAASAAVRLPPQRRLLRPLWLLWRLLPPRQPLQGLQGREGLDLRRVVLARGVRRHVRRRVAASPCAPGRQAACSAGMWGQSCARSAACSAGVICWPHSTAPFVYFCCRFGF